MKNNNDNTLPQALGISVLLHLILFFLFVQFGSFFSKLFHNIDIPPEKPPLVLEFEQPAAPAPAPQPENTPQPVQTPQLPEKYFLIEDNPNANEQQPRDADILAAKASVSAAPQRVETQNPPDLPPVDKPEPTIKDLRQEEPQPPAEPEAGLTLPEIAGDFAYLQNKKFSRDLLSEKPESRSETESREASQPRELPPLEREFKGDLIGDVALSTYEWRWAPWLLSLKEAFYRHLYVPRAYNMGLIDGYTEVWLKVDRSGKLVDHKLVYSAGHPSLKESTLNAFLASVPWKALPADFPDPFLELRIRVIYPNLKELFQKQRASN